MKTEMVNDLRKIDENTNTQHPKNMLKNLQIWVIKK